MRGCSAQTQGTVFDDPAGAAANKIFDKGETFTFKVGGLKDLTVAVKTKHAVETDSGTGIKLDKNDTYPTDNTFEVAISTGAEYANGGALSDAFSIS